jgi:hypothetical protein
MKWTYVVKQKVKIASVLGAICLLILVINVMHKNGYSKIRDSFDTVYKDRLVVEAYIYELSSNLNKKRWLTTHEEITKIPSQRHGILLNDTIQQLITQFGQTKLTASESILFQDLKVAFQQLCLLETGGYHDENTVNQEKTQHALKFAHERLSTILHQLSGIQLAETQRIIADSNKIIAFGGMTSQLELAVIVFMGLIGQVLIFASKSAQPKFPQQSNLN